MIGGSRGGLGGKRLGAGPDEGVLARLPLIAAVIVLVFAGFGVRLFQLQLVQGEELHLLSRSNSVRTVRLEAPRGDILDRHGRVLATTRPAFAVEVVPHDLRRRQQKTLQVLGYLLGEEPDALGERVAGRRGRARFQPVRLVTDASADVRGRVESHRFALPGVSVEWRPRRHYVGGPLAAHALGTIGEITKEQLESRSYAEYRAGEVVGQGGLEKVLEADLRGRAGGRNEVVDVSGRLIATLGSVEPAPGGSVRLTLDTDLQSAAEEAFRPDVIGEPEKIGALVALDPRNGDVLALVSKPSFDPNDFAGGIDSATWERLTTDEWRPLQNRAISGQYPPGSTYKAIVAAAGLQEGLADPGKRVFCPGHFRLGRRVYRCWKREGHGWMDLRSALKESCDVYFYQLGLALGIDRLAYFARGFQLGKRTGIGLSHEKSGLVPTEAWKERRFREPWVKGETVSAAIGQGFNLTTPLQLAVAFAALANGGQVMRPRLVLERTDAEGRVSPGPPAEVVGTAPVDAHHLARVVEALEAVVGEAGGTARRARVPGVRVAGKTGTAQVVRLKHTEDYEDEDEIPVRFRDHGWFVGFAPVEAPEIVVVALAEHGGAGSRSAAPIVQAVLARYFEGRGPAPADAPGEAAPEPAPAAGPEPPPPLPPSATAPGQET